MRRRVLVVAAEQFELDPLRKAVSGRDDVEFVFVANGPGPKLAGEAVESAGAAESFDAFVSVGLCGALETGIGIAAIVVADAVNGRPVARPGGAGGTVRGPIASVDYVAGTVEEKRRLRNTGAIAVEMEAAAVHEKACKAGKPFFAVKAVSDTADEGFTLDLNAARDRDGRFSVMHILGQALRSPVTGFPELVRLKRNGGRALNALGDFFANCSF
jgi:adenosylhomocysteine nucleosidase